MLVIHILRINSACSESILNPAKPVSHLGKALGMDRTRYDTSTHTYIYTYIHYITFHSITLHNITYIHTSIPFRSVPFHYIHYITFRCTTLHYTTLHTYNHRYRIIQTYACICLYKHS